MSRRVDPIDYVLGELEPADLVEAERLIATDDGFRAEVKRLQPVASRLEALPAEAWDPVAPPPLRHPEPHHAPRATAPRAAESVRRPWWRRRLVVPPFAVAAAAGVLLALGVGAGVLIAGGVGGDETSSTVAQVALRPVGSTAPAASGSATLVSDGGRELELRVHGLKANGPSGDYYELWLMNSTNDLVSLGSFRVPPSGTATVQVPVPVDPAAFKFVDISLEPADGNPRHSGDSVLQAPVV